MKGIRTVILFLLAAQSVHATLMTVGSLQVMSTLIASAGQPSQTSGSIGLTHIVAPQAGFYIPHSFYYSCGILNNVYRQGGAIQLAIPDSSVPADFYLRVSQNLFATPGFDPADIQTANQKAVAQGGPYRQPIPNGIFEVAGYDPNGNIINGQFSKQATLSLTVQDNALGGTTPQIRVDSLSLWTLDTSQMMWRNLPNSTVDVNNKVVSANVQNFGVYAIMGAADTALGQIIVYPIPWRPHSGNPLTGTEAGGITFDLLPSDCTIQIFTTSGQLVREIQHSGGSSVENWDVKTSGGNNVASGLYIYLITDSSGHKTGKLIVIR